MRITTIILAVCLSAAAARSSMPAPTAERAQNPTNPSAAESPRPSFLAEAPAPPAEPAPQAVAHDDRTPGAQASTGSAAPEGAAVVILHTCPMHPEVRALEPGSCPKCRMTLVPITDKSRDP